MPDIAPFRALRYAPSAGELSRLIAPPYDVIGPAERETLAGRSPHNIVHVDLPAGEDKYARAGRMLREWIERGVLARDEAPALYALEQRFTALGAPRVRRGLLALLRLHEFSEGIVLPHERTLSGPKQDRMLLMQATAANLSPIFGLFPDDENAVGALLGPLTERAPDAEAQTDDGVAHRMWRIEDRRAIAAVRAALAEKKVYIADGHHRYETALAYGKALGPSTELRTGKGKRNGGHHYLVSFLCSMSDPGLVILPTHRLVVGLPNFAPELFEKLLDEFFLVEDAGDVSTDEGRAAALSRLREAGTETHAFLMLFAKDPRGRMVKKRQTVDTTHVHALPKNPTVRALDVSILHGLILEHTLGLSQESQARQENLRYVKDPRGAVGAALSGEAQVAFVMNPTPMWQVRAVAEAGEVMPQKSTFFYPKLATGLVVRMVDPAEEIE